MKRIYLYRGLLALVLAVGAGHLYFMNHALDEYVAQTNQEVTHFQMYVANRHGKEF